MFFSLPGFQNWQFRYVLHGGTMLLEAVRDDQHLSAILEPRQSIARKADHMIRTMNSQES